MKLLLKGILFIVALHFGIGAFGQEELSNDSVPVAHGSGKGEGATLSEAWKQAYATALQNLYEYYYDVQRIDILMDNNKCSHYWNLPHITSRYFKLWQVGEKYKAEVGLETSISQKEWVELKMTLDTIRYGIKN